MTDPTEPIPPDTNRWYTVATDAVALSLPGGALLRVAASSIGHGGIVFVPGVVVEPIGHSHHGYARIVSAVPAMTIEQTLGEVLGTRSTWADAAKALRPEAGRHADPSTADSRPVSDLHLRPPTAQGVGPAERDWASASLGLPTDPAPAPKPACTCASDLRMAAGMIRQAANVDDPATTVRCRIAAGYDLAADLLETPELG